MAPDVDHSANIGRQGDLVVFDRSSDTVPERTPEALYPGQACRLPELPQLFVTRVSPWLFHTLSNDFTGTLALTKGSWTWSCRGQR